MNEFATMTPETEHAFTAWSQPQARSQRPESHADLAVEVEADQTEASRLHEAYQAGRREAIAEHADALEDLQAVAATLRDALDQVDHLRNQAMAENAGIVSEMITTVTRRVLGASIAMHPDALPHLVRRTIEQMPAREGLTVSVPAAQAERIQRSVGTEFGVPIVPDITLQDGCVVRSEGVHIESSLNSVMEGVEAAVAEWTKNQPPTLDTLGNP